jgi:hypothetical protein
VRYEDLFTRSARIVWRRPWLWLLALLAGETYAGGGGGGGASFTGSTSTGASSAPDLGWVPGWLGDRAGLILTVAVALLVLGLLLFLLSCLASGALIGAAARLDAGDRVTFGQSWGIGARAFGRVLGFKLVQILLVLLGLLVLLLAPLTGAAVGGTNGFLKGLALDLPVLVVSAAWITFVGALAVLGLRACVLDGTGPVGSYRAAYRLLAGRFSRIALTWLLFVAAGIGVGIVFSIVLSLVTVPFYAPVLTDLTSGRWQQAFNGFLLAAAIALPVSFLLSSAAGAYFATAWTVAYRRFGLEGEVPAPPALAA